MNLILKLKVHFICGNPDLFWVAGLLSSLAEKFVDQMRSSSTSLSYLASKSRTRHCEMEWHEVKQADT